MSDTAEEPVSFYVEHLDLYQFDDPGYEGSLEAHFREKYRNKHIGVIAAIGPSALQYALRFRATLWPSVPIVFALRLTHGYGVPAERETRLSLMPVSRLPGPWLLTVIVWLAVL